MIPAWFRRSSKVSLQPVCVCVCTRLTRRRPEQTTGWLEETEVSAPVEPVTCRAYVRDGNSNSAVLLMFSCSHTCVQHIQWHVNNKDPENELVLRYLAHYCFYVFNRRHLTLDFILRALHYL